MWCCYLICTMCAHAGTCTYFCSVLLFLLLSSSPFEWFAKCSLHFVFVPCTVCINVKYYTERLLQRVRLSIILYGIAIHTSINVYKAVLIYRNQQKRLDITPCARPVRFALIILGQRTKVKQTMDVDTKHQTATATTTNTDGSMKINKQLIKHCKNGYIAFRPATQTKFY